MLNVANFHSSFLASKKCPVSSLQPVYFSSLLATKPKVCINFPDHHQLLMGWSPYVSTAIHLFGLPPWRCRRCVWFAFLTSLKRSFFMIMIFSSKNRLRHEWDLISHACHSHRKKQKDRHGRSPQSHCFHLPHTWRFRGRCNFNWTIEALELLSYLLTREEDKAFTIEVSNLVVSEGRSGPHRTNFIHPKSCQNLISVNLVQCLFQAPLEWCIVNIKRLSRRGFSLRCWIGQPTWLNSWSSFLQTISNSRTEHGKTDVSTSFSHRVSENWWLLFRGQGGRMHLSPYTAGLSQELF